jgi:hypothetical protein
MYVLVHLVPQDVGGNCSAHPWNVKGIRAAQSQFGHNLAACVPSQGDSLPEHVC